MLWVEKYRPTTWDGIVGNKDAINEIRQSVTSGEMSHLMFTGPAGTGKTTTAYVIARELYGDADDTRFRELNASDERGINTIRDKVKKFASRSTLDGGYRIIFLDEADSLTNDAQQALRRIMENYHETCRFILTGNFVDGFIGALKSRCSDYRFDPPEPEESIKVLRRIRDAEDLDISDEVLEKVTHIYKGDIRGQVNKLQALSHLDEVDPDNIDSGEDYVKLYNLIGQREYMAAIRVADQETIQRMYNYMMNKDEIPPVVKAKVSPIMAKYDWRMNRSADREIQMNALIAELCEQLGEYIKK